MSDKKECCDVKVKKTEDGIQVNISNVDIEKAIESWIKNRCSCCCDCDD